MGNSIMDTSNNTVTVEDGIIIETPPMPAATKPTIVIFSDDSDLCYEASDGIDVIVIDYDDCEPTGLRGEALRLARRSGFDGGESYADAESNDYCYYDAGGEE